MTYVLDVNYLFWKNEDNSAFFGGHKAIGKGGFGDRWEFKNSFEISTAIQINPTPILSMPLGLTYLRWHEKISEREYTIEPDFEPESRSKFNSWLLSAGLYFQSKKYYAGLSIIAGVLETDDLKSEPKDLAKQLKITAGIKL